eukprot:TRINITY_DN6282_c1_g1_i1.p1 TRINITY_DN6282_c1_g1~~TRINITY_DN6282_c1_g1_i1.p1  ORF type:complete len:602 (+),score=108.46 TRINITY_DN6282_c1_g1_i1:54-1808(+)
MAVNGLYERQPVENEWHQGSLKIADGRFRWANSANATWFIDASADEASSAISKGISAEIEGEAAEDSSYPGAPFTLIIKKGQVIGFDFNDERYTRVGDLPPEDPAVSAMRAKFGTSLTELGLETLATVWAAGDVFRNSGDCARALQMLRKLIDAVPVATKKWGESDHNDKHFHFGEPVAYATLRCMLDCFETAEKLGESNTEEFVNMTITIVSGSVVAEPGSHQNLERCKTHPDEFPKKHYKVREELTQDAARAQFGGDPLCHPKVSHTVFDGDCPAAIRKAMYWFGEWVYWVLMQTRARLRVRCVWPQTDAVCFVADKFAVPDDNFQLVEQNVPANIKNSSDWFWTIHPSVTRSHPGYGKDELVTGGMQSFSNQRMHLTCDDTWVLTKPAHLSDMVDWSDEERMLYFHQWFQHEMCHHLFELYKHHDLETVDHGWFNRESWPEDFEGEFEPDYFYESLHKRILPDDIPPHIRMRQSSCRIDLSATDLACLEGTYHGPEADNDWHHGTLSLRDDGTFKWTNRAGTSWRLQPQLERARLRIVDGPYFQEDGSENGFVFKFDCVDGQFELSEQVSFVFGEEEYAQE